jgi:hypothetical protein
MYKRGKHVDGSNKYDIEVEYNDGKWEVLKSITTKRII